jgi:hypothetical protein
MNKTRRLKEENKVYTNKKLHITHIIRNPASQDLKLETSKEVKNVY